jgi:nucleotide-binding universal stress UspA family protein
MSSILIVLTNNEPDTKLLSAAERYVTGTDTNTILCRFIDRKDYQNDVKRQSTGKQVDSIDMKENEAKEEATDIGKQYFDTNIQFTSVGLVGTIPDDIVRLADENDCEHIFVTGKTRSPSGKALFGDVAQSLILDFDGAITVTTK